MMRVSRSLELPVLLRSGFVLVLGNGLQAVLQWLYVVYLFRTTDAAVAGAFAVSVSVAVPIFSLLALSLRQVMVLEEGMGARFGVLLAIRLASIFLALPAFLIAVSLLEIDSRFHAVVWLAFLSKAVDNISDLLYGKMQRDGSLFWQGISLTLKALIGIAVLALLGRHFPTPLHSLSTVIICSLLVTLILDTRLAGLWQRATSHDFSRSDVHSGLLAIKSGFILTVSAAAAALAFNIPRLAVQWSDGEAEAGRFSALLSVTLAGMLVASSVGTVLLRPLSQARSLGTILLHSRVLMLLFSIVLLTWTFFVVCLFLFGGDVTEALYGQSFGEAELPWLALAATPMMLAQLLSFVSLALSPGKPQVVISCVSLLSVAVASMLLRMQGLELGIAILAILGFSSLLGYSVHLLLQSRSKT